MRLAIIHYHLRRGGVTKVIASAVEALGNDVEAIVLSSAEPEDPLPCPVGVVPELGYTEEASQAAVDALHRGLRNKAHDLLGGSPDVWHIHNHSLGKNVNFPPVVNRLAADGERLLLQIHDFAEDGRPGNYAAQQKPYADGTFKETSAGLYPCGPHIRYAVLNGRDRHILEAAGIPRGSIVWLPNAVTIPSLQTGADPQTGRPGRPPLILYPTRAIRRKNIGELLLLAAARPDYRYATTLSPKNRQWEAVYRSWVDLGTELNLPVEFALGERPGQTFEGLIREARAMITTSVGEGFGLAFLEPWLMGKSVNGRDLPEITGDFKANGIALPGLYTEWRIPLEFLDHHALRERFTGTAASVYRAYGRELSRKAVSEAWATLTGDGCIDCGSMDETAQAEVLRTAVAGRARGRLPAPADPGRADPEASAANAAIIRETYGLSPYGKLLKNAFNSLMETSPGDIAHADAGRILDAFITPENLRLLRT